MTIDQSALGEFVSAIRGAVQPTGKTNEYLTGVVTKTDLDGTIWVDVAGGVNAMPVIRSTSSYSPGDVVSFTIENGVASIGGNVSDPAPSGTQIQHVEKQVEVVETTVEKIGNVVADKADIVELRAARADISQLQAVDVTITGRLTAAEAEVDNLVATKADISDLNAAKGRIDDLEADHVSTTDLQAVNVSITSLQAEDATINGKLTAAEGDIDTLQANTADIGTIRANAAKVQNVTAQQITAATGYISDLTAGNVTAASIISDHAAVGNLDANYAQIDMANVNNAWITNGTIKDGAISSAMINDVSANKLTAGTINGSVINVTNLNADNITTGTINGQRIGEGSLSLDKLSDDVYTESEVDAKLSTMQQQIDGAIETWTGTDVPTLQNAPASSWTTAQLKDQHVGDVYFVVNSQSQQNGYNYRFTKTGSSYSWQLIKDSDVTNALQRLETAEGKITTFESDISTLQTDTGTLKTKTTSLETRMSDAESDILDKVDTTDFNELSDTVDGHTQTLSQHTTAISNKADSSTVTALTTRVNKNETDISGINTTIGELQTTVASKADGSALTTVSNKLNTVSDTVDGHTQTISSVQSTLATKADSSTVSTLRSEYNETKTTVSGHETRLTATESVANGVRTDFDNLEIGGRNLLHGSGTFTGDLVRNSGAYADGGYGGAAIRMDSANAWRGAYIHVGDALARDNAQIGDAYVLSMWVRHNEEDVLNPTGGSVSLSFELPRLLVSGATKLRIDNGDEAFYPYVHDMQPGVWHRLWCAFEVNEYSLTASTVRFEANQNKSVSMSAPKLERGNKPTDWTPAPEDLETEVTTLKTDYATYKQTTTESLTQIGTRMTTAEGKIATAETNIASNASAIALNASKLETVANPNLSPFFSINSVYKSSDGSGYWQEFQKFYSLLDDGWAHVSSESLQGTYFTQHVHRAMFSSFEPGTYTLLTELRNIEAVGSITYTVLNWPASMVPPNTQPDGFIRNAVLTEASDSIIIRTVLTCDPEYSTNTRGLGFTFEGIASGESISADIRLSLYKGEYTGPWKPYSGNLLYASQAELKIANDSISSKVSQSDFNTLSGRVDTAESTITQHATDIAAKVSKNGVIAAINLSTETEGGSVAKISADKVQINGQTTFTAIKQYSDAAYDEIGAASDAVSALTTDLASSSGTTVINGGHITTGSLSIGQVANLSSTLDGKADDADIPTNVSDLANDANYATTTQVGTAKSEAISAAATDATTKANAAQAAAEATAAADATSKANDAKKYATNYIALDPVNGIRIADANPATATTYQHQTATETEFVVEGTSMAEFGGSGARIGDESGTHLTLDADSISMDYSDSLTAMSFTSRYIKLSKNLSGVMFEVTKLPATFTIPLPPSGSYVRECQLYEISADAPVFAYGGSVVDGLSDYTKMSQQVKLINRYEYNYYQYDSATRQLTVVDTWNTIALLKQYKKLYVGIATADYSEVQNDPEPDHVELDAVFNGNMFVRNWAGMIQMFGGVTPPPGWLLCDGSAVSRTEYPELFAAIGTTWGRGDGSTSFNVPDLRGRMAVGSDPDRPRGAQSKNLLMTDGPYRFETPENYLALRLGFRGAIHVGWTYALRLENVNISRSLFYGSPTVSNIGVGIFLGAGGTANHLATVLASEDNDGITTLKSYAGFGAAVCAHADCLTIELDTTGKTMGEQYLWLYNSPGTGLTDKEALAGYMSVGRYMLTLRAADGQIVDDLSIPWQPHDYFSAEWNRYALGEFGGQAGFCLSESQLAGHTHAKGTLAITASGGHTHTVKGYGKDLGSGSTGYRFGSGGNETVGIGMNSPTHTHPNANFTGNTGSTGSSRAIDLMNPYAVVHYIIHTGKTS